ncbi:MAG: dihydrofolate reductase family protein [Ignavibacteria bacterium]|nr:dihydrofolate reductase family protein [Ignavibacteria bacterium]
MRKLKLQVQISVDGYVAGPNGEEDWIVKSDEKLWQLINETADSSDTILLGRKMAEGFIPHFETFKTDSPVFSFAQKMVNIQKIIFTRTLEKPFGKNTSLAKENLQDEIARLKNQNGKDILVYGGAGFVSSLIAGGHIDEFLFFVNPVMINKGMRIFDLPDKRQKLSLISAVPYKCGVTVLRYKLNRE